MAIDLFEYTKDMMADLDTKDIYITHIYITYKVILYYKNNFGALTQEVKPKLLEIINNIYETYTNIDEVELIDSLVIEKLNNL